MVWLTNQNVPTDPVPSRTDHIHNLELCSGPRIGKTPIAGPDPDLLDPSNGTLGRFRPKPPSAEILASDDRTRPDLTTASPPGRQLPAMTWQRQCRRAGHPH